jgi:hypothetical protein
VHGCKMNRLLMVQFKIREPSSNPGRKGELCYHSTETSLWGSAVVQARGIYFISGVGCQDVVVTLYSLKAENRGWNIFPC